MLYNKILVLGGTYFLGRNFIQQSSNLKNIDITMFNRGNRKVDSECNFFKGDRNNLYDLERLFNGKYYDLVIDFSCISHSQTIKLLKYKQNFGDIIFISTGLIYGEGLEIADETCKVRDVSNFKNYVMNKYLSEIQIINSKKNYVILRPSLIYGPFEYQKFSTDFFKSLILKGNITKPDDQWKAGNIQPLFVEDLVSTLINVMRAGVDNEVYNVSGPFISVEDYLQCIVEVFNKKKFNSYNLNFKNITNMDFRYDIPYNKHINISSSKIIRKFKAEFNTMESLKNGLDKTYEWVRWYLSCGGGACDK